MAFADREPTEDKSCSEIIRSTQSGYCECSYGARRYKVPYICGHEDITCFLVCDENLELTEEERIYSEQSFLY